MQKIYFLPIKISVVFISIYILIKGDRFDLSAQVSLFKKPELLAILLVLWVFSFIVLVALRWIWVAQMLGLSMSFLFSLHTQITAVFLGSWLPTSVGGDFWKAYKFGQCYDSVGKKNSAYLSVILDRAIGLYAITTLGTICVLCDLNNWRNSQYFPLAMFLVAISSFMTIFLILLFYKKNQISTLISILPIRFAMLTRLARAFSDIELNHLHMLRATLTSFVIQSINIYFLMLIAQDVTDNSIAFSALGSIYAISLIASIISLAPGGFGVGHLTFDILLSQLGFTHGADIFNVFFIITALFSLIGILIFILPIVK